MIKIGDEEFFEVELYFGVRLEEVGSYEYELMWRIQADYDDGTMGKGIGYYAAMYGY